MVNKLNVSYNITSSLRISGQYMNKVSKDNAKDKIVRLCFDTPISLRKALKLQAAQDDKEMKEALHELIQGYINGKFKLN